MNDFEQRNQLAIQRMAADSEVAEVARKFYYTVQKFEYSYHFSWLGRPVIQFPQDIVAVQEIIWNVKPDLIVETGIARGGSLIFHASMLELLQGDGLVVGIDIDIREHNRVAIEAHPLFKRIRMIQGSSVSPEVMDQVRELAKGKKRILVCLDSNHTHEHVLEELRLYSPLVRRGSYLIVFDTIIEDMPEDFVHDRPWGKGNNPKTAVREFLTKSNRFEVDREIDSKLLLTAAPGGYLKCVMD